MDIDRVYEEHVRPLPLVDRLSLAARIVAQAAIESGSTVLEGDAAGIEPLGVRLRAIRARIVQSGEPLLDEEGLRRELGERRGGIEGLELHAHLR